VPGGVGQGNSDRKPNHHPSGRDGDANASLNGRGNDGAGGFEGRDTYRGHTEKISDVFKPFRVESQDCGAGNVATTTGLPRGKT